MDLGAATASDQSEGSSFQRSSFSGMNPRSDFVPILAFVSRESLDIQARRCSHSGDQVVAEILHIVKGIERKS